MAWGGWICFSSGCKCGDPIPEKGQRTEGPLLAFIRLLGQKGEQSLAGMGKAQGR